ncbi:MAG: DegT/DnrJ/EryC1/StrS family aminotransferase, partial [Acidobacteria bacterium]|nr:DegT/DnrJ/EryC1/StrS family aminotransferase [Acidobacteriota bacterium]
RTLAARYRDRQAAAPVTVPPEHDAGHVYHLFPILTPSRDALQARLAAAGVETLIHYPVAIPDQPALAATHPAQCPIATRLAGELLSLPLHPALDGAAVDAVANLIHS